MKRLLLVACLLLAGSCAPTIVKLTPEQIAESQAREQQRLAKWQAERESLENRFKEAYGDQWKQKLLEYDLEQERIQRQAQLEEARLQRQEAIERERQRREYLAKQKTLSDLEAEYAEKGRQSQEDFEQQQNQQTMRKLDQYLLEQERKRINSQ